jgi:hypothetical protein
MMVYFSSRPSTDKVHTVQMLSKDMQSGECLENLNPTPVHVFTYCNNEVLIKANKKL